jgi:excisionase family DNA binding protein
MSKKLEIRDLSCRLAFSRQEVAAALGCSVRHLIAEVKRGKIRESIVGNRMRRISRKELDRYLAEGEQQERNRSTADAA